MTAPATTRVLLLLPLFLGLVACLPSFPVPVGDPEKSRIDPYISGIWVSTWDDGKAVLVFEPYDKRTWLLSITDISAEPENCEVAEDNAASDQETLELSSYEELIADIAKLGKDCYELEYAPRAWKIWRTKLGGVWFMTWEPLGQFDAKKGFAPKEWDVRGIDKSSPNQLNLRLISDQNDAWDGIDEEDLTRRRVEKIIRKNARDPNFFEEDGDLELHRVLPEHYKLVEEFLAEG
jgi:hypothetical protein